MASLSFGLSSCSKSEEPDFELHGEWIITVKQIKCFGVGDAENEAKAEQSLLQKEFNKNMLTSTYIYTFGDIYDTANEQYFYSEDLYKNLSGTTPLTAKPSYLSERSISGYYERDGSRLIVSAGRRFTNIIEDLNKDYLMFVEELNAQDIEAIYKTYFSINRKIDPTITGTLTTKAVRVKAQ